MFTGGVGEGSGIFTAPGKAENKTKIDKMSNMEENICALNETGLVVFWTDCIFS